MRQIISEALAIVSLLMLLGGLNDQNACLTAAAMAAVASYKIWKRR